MRPTLRAILILALIVPLAVIGVVGYLTVSGYMRRAQRTLPALIAQEGTQLLKRPVHVGGATYRAGKLILRDVTIDESPSFPHRGPLAEAASVEIDLSPQRILFEKRRTVPIVPRIVVHEPRVRVRRDRAGQWNFAGVFPKQKAKPVRMAVGEVVVSDGAVTYDDRRLTALAPRAARLIRAGADRVSGTIRFDAEGDASWTATGQCDTGQARAVRCSGTYLRGARSVLLVADAADASVPIVAAAFAPAGVRASQGTAYAQAVISWHVGPGAPHNLDYRGIASVRGATVSVPHLREPLREIAGTLGMVDDQTTFDLTGSVRAGRIHAHGTMRGLKAPEIAARLDAPRVDLAALSSALSLPRIGGSALWAAGVASASATVTGRFHLPALRLSGDVMLRRATAAGATIGPGRLHVEVAGTLSDPAVAVTGRVDQVAYRGVRASAMSVSAGYRSRRVGADVRMQVARGRAAGRVDILWQHTPPRYAARLRIRDVALSDLPQPKGHRLGGRADADLRLAGTLRGSMPTGRADVQVYGPNFDDQSVQSVRLEATSASPGEIRVDSLVVRDGDSHVAVQGTVDAKARTLDLQAEADAVDLGEVAARTGLAAPHAVTGLLYLRSGAVTGPWSNPQLAGALHVFGFSYGDVDFEEARATVLGTKSELHVEDGYVLRAPAESTFSGVLREPFTAHAMASLTGAFHNLELLDIARLTSPTASVTGTAHGQYVVAGPLRKPRVEVSPLVVEAAGVDDFVLDHFSASIDYEPGEPHGVVRVSGLDARRQGATLTGSATVVLGESFTATARMSGLDVSTFSADAAPYATVAGIAAGSLNVGGSLLGGRISDLNGTVEGDVTGAAVNDVACGSVHLRGRLEHDVLAPDRSAGATAVLTFGPATPWLQIARASREPHTGALDVTGAVDALPAEIIRRVVTSSLYFHEHSSVLPADWLKPAAGGTPGTLSMAFHIAGPPSSAGAHLEWTAAGLSARGHALKTFKGSADIDRTALRLQDLTIMEAEAVLRASGTLRYGRAIDGTLDVTGLNFDDLRPWLPDLPAARSLHGTLDDLYVTASGSPESPAINASLALRDVRWTAPSGYAMAGRTVAVSSLRVAGATIKSGRLSVADVSVAFAGSPMVASSSRPSPAAGDVEAAAAAAVSATAVPAQSYEVHASGDLGFEWRAPFVLQDAPAHVMVAVRHQRLPAGRPVLDMGQLSIDGVLDAEVEFGGTWRQLVSPRSVLSRRQPAPTWKGHVNLIAKRIRYATMRTVLSGVDAYLVLTGSSIRVAKDPATGHDFTARVDVLDPTGKRVSEQGDLLHVAGELPIRIGGPGSGIEISDQRVVFAESPLPVLDSGSISGELSTLSSASPGLDLAIRGALYDPLVSGVLNVRKCTVGLPTTIPATAARGPVLPIVSGLNIAVNLGEQVKVHTALIAADVTEVLRVRTAVIDADVRTYAGVPFRLTGTTVDPRLLGTLVIDRGTMEFPTAHFNIQPGGTVHVRYPGIGAVTGGGTGLEVQVDLTATTRITALSEFGVRKSYRVTAEARGPVTTPTVGLATGVTQSRISVPGLRLSFRTDPSDMAFTQVELQAKIIGILGGQEALAELLAPRAQYGRIVGEGIASAVSSSVLPDLFERSGLTRALGLNELSLGYVGGSGAVVSVSRPLFGPISLSYWQRLTRSDSGEIGVWEFSANLQLRRDLQLSWTVDDQRTNALLIEGVFRF